MGLSQGTTQGATQSTTQETIQQTTFEPELCSLCMNTYQRKRQSVCTCNHCSLPLCSDCMHDHIDELPKSLAQLSHQYHELEQLFQTKKDMVQQEVSNSNVEIKECLKTYQNELLEACHAISIGIKNAEQDAEKHLSTIYSELQSIEVDIQTLAGERIFQPKRMEALLNQLNQIQEKLEAYKMTKVTELQIVVPKYTLKFQYIPASTTDTIELSEAESANLQDNSGKKSSRRNQFHPYKKLSGSVRTKSILFHNGETDHS